MTDNLGNEINIKDLVHTVWSGRPVIGVITMLNYDTLEISVKFPWPTRRKRPDARRGDNDYYSAAKLSAKTLRLRSVRPFVKIHLNQLTKYTLAGPFWYYRTDNETKEKNNQAAFNMLLKWINE
jgi:hypothetical protein